MPLPDARSIRWHPLALVPLALAAWVYHPVTRVFEGRLIEIPVNYYRRRSGESKHSTSRWHSAKTGLRVIRLILQKRLNLH
jgi:hypothetical protein